ncbi:MAG: phosphate ABC transporter substrate-binding protein [Anaerolineaceae bacterium]|nr:phosphate ABC transporter substrate-binding protein [Anaerolineaceae bacterium]
MRRTLAIAAFALVSCSAQTLPAATPISFATPLRLYATTATVPLMQDLIVHYTEAVPNALFETMTGDYEAMLKAVLADPDAYLLVGYLPGESDLWAAPVGQDGIAIITHPDTGVSGLSSDQLRRIYQGQVASWHELGGNDQELVVISREDGSGTRAAFEHLVMGERITTLSAQVAPSSAAVVTSVAQQPGSIGYISMSYVDDTVRVLRVDDSELTADTVLDNTYPLRSTLYMVGAAEPQDEAYRHFIAWIQSIEGQAVVGEHYAPLLRLGND